MKKPSFIAATAALALAACQASDEPAAPAGDTASEAVAEMAMMAPDGLPTYGVFRVTSADGQTAIMQNIKQDGTLVNVVADGDPVPGTWSTDADNNFCITLEGAEGTNCYAETMADGVWSAVNIADPADRWTVQRIMGSEALPTESAR